MKNFQLKQNQVILHWHKKWVGLGSGICREKTHPIICIMPLWSYLGLGKWIINKELRFPQKIPSPLQVFSNLSSSDFTTICYLLIAIFFVPASYQWSSINTSTILEKWFPLQGERGHSSYFRCFQIQNREEGETE